MTRSPIMLVALLVPLVVLATLALLLGRWLRRRVRARRAARQIGAALAGAPTHPAARSPAVEALEAELMRALCQISEAVPGLGARKAPYALPWYLVLGAAGAGKRSALRAADLQLAQPGETVASDCACWLGRDVLLLASDGRFDGDTDARGGWLALLGVLRRLRPRRPLDGVVLAIDVQTLLPKDAAMLEAGVQLLRARLLALTLRLGMVVPVYVVLTQCDRLPGFLETFADLRRAERRQVWGFTLPSTLRASARDALVTERFARLVQVLERRAIARVGELSTLEERAAVHALPSVLAGLAAPLQQLITRVFGDDLAQPDAPIVRGVYLTSAPQRTSTRALPSALGLADDAELTPSEERHEDAGDGFFLAALFPEVILPDARLATTSRRVRRKRRAIAMVGALAVGVLASCMASLPALAYVENRRLLGQVRDALQRTPRRAASRAAALSELEPLRRVVHTLLDHAQRGVPRGYGMGLYQGHVLRDAVTMLYASQVRTLLIVPHAHGTADALDTLVRTHASPGARPGAATHARAYALLKAYLLLTRDDTEATASLVSRHARWIASHLTQQLSERSSADDAGRVRVRAEALREHVGTFVALLSDRPVLGLARDAGVVARARALLSRVPAVELALDRVEAELDPLALDLTLEALLGTSGLPLRAAAPARGVYTRRGWEQHVRGLLEAPPAALLGEPWVLAREGAQAADATDEARRCALRAAYFARYVDSWQQFLSGLRLAPPADPAQTLASLEALTRGQPPPLEQLAREVARQAQLEERAAEPRPEDGLLRRLERALGNASVAPHVADRDACAQPGRLGPAGVRAALRGFYAFGVGDPQPAAGDAQAAAPVTAARLYHEQLAFVRDALRAHALDPSDPAPLLARLEAAGSAVRQLIDAQEVGWRPRFEALLWPPLEGARATSGGDVARAKSAAWCGTVVPAFERALRDRYPFTRSGQDAALSDLEAFYRPASGVLWEAYEATLARDIPRTGDRYQVRPGSPVARMYRPQLPVFLERSQAITRALFPHPDEAAQVALEVRVRPTKALVKISLSVDGQALDFHNGSERWMPLRWPGPGDERGAQLRVHGVGIDEQIEQEGEWGLFRLLESGSMVSAAGMRAFSVRFRLGTQSDVVLDVRPARTDSPLLGASGRMLEAFRAPGVAPPRDIARGARACR